MIYLECLRTSEVLPLHTIKVLIKEGYFKKDDTFVDENDIFIEKKPITIKQVLKLKGVKNYHDIFINKEKPFLLVFSDLLK